MVSAKSTDGRGAGGTEESSPGGIGGVDGLASSNADNLASSKKNRGVSSRGGGIRTREGAFYNPGTPYDRASLIKLLILLIGFLVIVILIWRAFQPVIGKSDDKRQLSEWRAAKDARTKDRDHTEFGGDRGMAA